MGSVPKHGHSWDLQKIESPGGGRYQIFAKRVDKLEKGIDVEMRGLSRTVRSHLLSQGKTKVSFIIYFWVFQSFELAM